MRTLASVLLATTLLVAGGAARAGDTEDKAKDSAKHAGKTAAHGATGVGKGASRIYHTTASKVRRELARRTGDPAKKDAQLRKAAIHRDHARRKAAQTDREFRQAEREADQVSK